MPMPDFFTSEWFVPEVDNWHLKEGAPPEVVEEFEAYMMRLKENVRNNIVECATPGFGRWVVFSYPFAVSPVVGGKQNRGKSWFLTHGKKGFYGGITL